mgnify:CR=1 FL=1
MDGKRENYKWELLALLCLAFFINQGDRAIFGVVLPSIKSELQLTDTQLGMVGSVLFFTLAVMLPIAGYLGDLWNKKWIIICSLLFWSAATLTTGLAGGLAGLVLLRSVATAGGESFYAPAAFPLLAEHHTRTRSLALGVHQAALYVGVMTSGFMGRLIADRWGWRSAFYVFGGCGILLGLISIWRLRDTAVDSMRRPSALGASRPATGAAWKVFFLTKTALFLTVGCAAIVFVNNAYVVWAPEFVREKYGLSQAAAGGCSMFYHHAAALAGVVAGGRLTDRRVAACPDFRLRLMGRAMLLGVPAIACVGLAPGLVLTCLAMAVFGLFRGLYEANTHAALFDVIAPCYRASAVGIMSMCSFLLGSVSPWLLGWLRGVCPVGTGLSYGFMVLAVAYLIGSAGVGVARRFTFGHERYREVAA